MTAMLQSGFDVGPFLTHNFPVDSFQKGFDIMRSAQLLPVSASRYTQLVQ